MRTIKKFVNKICYDKGGRKALSEIRLSAH